MRAWLAPAPPDLVDAGIEWRGVTADELARGRESVWSVGISTHFGATPLRDYHRLLRLLALLCPEAAVVYDVDALCPRSGTWLYEAASATTPPAPSTLFTIHDVAPDGGAPHWLHTHGLARCGCLELDVLAVPADGAGLVGQLINAVAGLFLERGIPEPDEPFFAGEQLELVWLPWNEAVERVSEDVAGGRADRDLSHGGARGVLLCPRDHQSPAAYLEILRDNPLLYVSDMETERMTLLASERLPRFLRLFERFGNSEGWMFLVKLGYAVDGAENINDREHLWFEVHGYESGEIVATLLNQPYRIARMSEGQRARHSLDKLSDWSVMCESGRFDPSNIATLERMLLGASGAH